MDAFEQVVAGLLFQEGFWVTQGFKVELTKQEKKEIGRPSSPRWEIDLLAYSGKTNELWAIECKSFLDSLGVFANEVIEGQPEKTRYKLFVDSKLREVVFRRLAIQAHDLGLIPEGVKPQLAMAAGKIRSEKDRERLSNHFGSMRWWLIEPQWLASRLLTSADAGYFDSVAHVVSKLIARNEVGQAAPENPLPIAQFR